MTAQDPPLKVFLDEGVPVSVGHSFEESGHEVIYFGDAAVPGSADHVIAAISVENNAILVAFDGDMRKLAQKQGVGRLRYKKLNLIKFQCFETVAASRLSEMMSLIEHEWALSDGLSKRRIFIEIGSTFVRSFR